MTAVRDFLIPLHFLEKSLCAGEIIARQRVVLSMKKKEDKKSEINSSPLFEVKLNVKFYSSDTPHFYSNHFKSIISVPSDFAIRSGANWIIRSYADIVATSSRVRGGNRDDDFTIDDKLDKHSSRLFVLRIELGGKSDLSRR